MAAKRIALYNVHSVKSGNFIWDTSPNLVSKKCYANLREWKTLSDKGFAEGRLPGRKKSEKLKTQHTKSVMDDANNVKITTIICVYRPYVVFQLMLHDCVT